MRRVEELLAKYNPNGVSPISLGDVLDYEQPSRFIVSSSEYDDNYDIPVLTAGQTFLLGYTNEKEGIYKASKNNPTIIFDDFTTGYHWVDFDFKVKSSAMKMLRLKNDKSLLRYVFHSMALINYSPTEHSRQWISKYSHFEIPLPHIKVQEEIVKILDSFTNLIDALNEELSLRQKQFEYYREKLLTFDDSVKRIKLEDIGYFYGGLSGKTKNDFIEGNKKFVSYMNVFTNSTICLDINDKVKISDGETQNKIAYGDILFTGSSETPNECGMSSVVTTDIDEEIYLNSFCFGYRFYNLDGISPKFFSFLMRSTLLRNEISKTANGVTRFNVSKKLLAKVNVFIPSLKVQQSIVSKLDAFESLISSLKEEIALRQKQYEYYREKLLTFE